MNVDILDNEKEVVVHQDDNMRRLFSGKDDNFRTKMNDFFNMRYESTPELTFMGIMVTVIFCSVATLIIGTSIDESNTFVLEMLQACNIAFDIIFTLEYIARCIAEPNVRSWLGNGFLWIDLFSILPFWTEVAGQGIAAELRFLKMVRLLKVAKYYSGTKLLAIAIQRSLGGTGGAALSSGYSGHFICELALQG